MKTEYENVESGHNDNETEVDITSMRFFDKEQNAWIEFSEDSGVYKHETIESRLCRYFCQEVDKGVPDVELANALLKKLAETEKGVFYIRLTVKSYFDPKRISTPNRISAIENIVIPFCKTNGIDIRKKSLKNI